MIKKHLNKFLVIILILSLYLLVLPGPFSYLSLQADIFWKSKGKQVYEKAGIKKEVEKALEKRRNALPMVSILSPANGSSSFQKKILISGSAAEGDTMAPVEGVYIKADPSGYTRAEGIQSWSQWIELAGEGTHTVSVRAVTAAGKYSEAQITVYVTYTAPRIAIVSPTNNSQATINLTLKGTSSPGDDGSPVQYVYIKINDGPYSPAQGIAVWSNTVSLSNSGTNIIRAKAVSAAGKYSETQITVYLTYTPPYITIVSPANNSMAKTSLTLKGTSSPGDDGTPVQYIYIKVNDGAYSPAQGIAVWSNTVSLQNSGTNIIYAKAVAENGSSSETSVIVFVPYLEFTHVPAYGQTSDKYLLGKAHCLNLSDYRVATYILVDAWYQRPMTGTYTAINSDGTFSCEIIKYANAEYCSQTAAFLIPNSYTPPEPAYFSSFPQELYDNAIAYKIYDRIEPVYFAGRYWYKKHAKSWVTGPGYNYWSVETNDIRVDGNGWLHMKIAQHGANWYCTEVHLTNSLGYGTYTFSLGSRVDTLDKKVVLGLFTYDDSTDNTNYNDISELDFEFSRWNQDVNDNSQYALQPPPALTYRFDITNTARTATIHTMEWRTNYIKFTSRYSNGDIIDTYTYNGRAGAPLSRNPVPCKETTRINLWLYQAGGNYGAPPSDGQAVDFIIKDFQFTP
ncbi:MAG: glycoside hydrolase family 16 protein [bacterium]|nr:glycoside hydrolase family 16 protein [bacterium]